MYKWNESCGIVGAFLAIVVATLSLPTLIWLFVGAEEALALTLFAITSKGWLNYCTNQKGTD